MKALLLLALLSFALPAHAIVQIGQPKVYRTAVCLTLESAQAVAAAEEKGGLPAADAVFSAAADCRVVTLRFLPLRVVKRYPTPETREALIVEAKIVGTDVTLWMLIDGPVIGESES